MNPDTIQEILRLRNNGMAKRAIGRKLGLNVKTVRRVLSRHGGDPPPASSTGVPQERPESKLTRYREAIQEKAEKGLTGRRILREIRAMGYTGGRTILMDYLREIRGASRRPRRAFQRFETGPGLEMQVDWSPYRVQIAGREQTVHCFSMILCHSRYLFIQFHRNERLPTLLAAHVDGFAFFRGTSRRIVYDNMATVTLGRRGRTILWNPAFLRFAQHYLFAPVLCRPGDPNRKGKIENPYLMIERDFLRGNAFESWEHLDQASHRWLREVANRRLHGTTRLVPEEAWLSERDFLIELPPTPYPVYQEEIRKVYDDGLIPFEGVRYSAPAHLVGTSVTVRAYPRYLEILDREGRVVARHAKPDTPGGLVLDPQHRAEIPRRPRGSRRESERRFLARFPKQETFLVGLKARMKSLYPIHVATILRFAPAYGDEAVDQALDRAAMYGNYSAYAVGRILRDWYPLVDPDTPPEPLLSGGETVVGIADVETGSFEEYRSYSEDPATDETDSRNGEEEEI